MAESLNISETKLELIQAIEDRKGNLHQEISILHSKIDAKENEVIAYLNKIAANYDSECKRIQTITKLKNFTLENKDLGSNYYKKNMSDTEAKLQKLASKAINSLEIRVNFKPESFDSLLNKTFHVSTPNVPDYTKKGDVIWEKGKKGSLRTQLNSPNSFDIDTSDNFIYVADTKNSRVQIYTDEGDHYFSLVLPDTFYPLIVKIRPTKLYVYGFGNDKYYLATCKKNFRQLPENSGFESFEEINELLSFDVPKLSKKPSTRSPFGLHGTNNEIVFGYLSNKNHVILSLQRSHQPSLFTPAPGGGPFGAPTATVTPGGGMFGPTPHTGGGFGATPIMGGGMMANANLGGGLVAPSGFGMGMGMGMGMGAPTFGGVSSAAPTFGHGGGGFGGNTVTTTSLFGSKPSEIAPQQQQQGGLFGGGGGGGFTPNQPFVKNFIYLKSIYLGDLTEAVEVRAMMAADNQCTLYVLYRQCKYAVLAFNTSGVCLKGIVESEWVKIPHAFCMDTYCNICVLSAEQKEKAATNTLKLDVDTEMTEITVFSTEADQCELVHTLTIREEVEGITSVGVDSDSGIVMLFSDGAEEGGMLRKY